MSLLIAFIAALLAAQQPLPTSLTFDQLRSMVTAAPPTAGRAETPAQELTVTLVTPPPPVGSAAPSAPPPPSQITMASRRRSVGPLPVERRPELSLDQLVVVGVDASGSIVSWSLARDPRVIRAEQPGAGGILSGRTIYRETADLLVALPDSSQIAEGAIYQPRWTGSEWQLNLIGRFTIGNAQ